MNNILRPQDLYHTGIVVRDIKASMAELSSTLGYRWAGPMTFTLPVLVGDIEQTAEFTFVYSIQAPYVELVQEMPGTIWTFVPGHAVHHVGYFVDDLPGTSRKLEEAGFVRAVCAVADGAPAAFAYHKSPSGIQIEIVDRTVFGGDFDAFLAQNEQMEASE